MKQDAGKRIDGPTSAEREELGAFDVRTIACVRERHPGKGGSLVPRGRASGEPDGFTGS